MRFTVLLLAFLAFTAIASETESTQSVSSAESVSSPSSVSDASASESAPETVSEPEESVSEPEESVSEPEETASEPEESVSEPETESASEPEESVSESESASEPEESAESTVSEDDENPQQGGALTKMCRSTGDPHYQSFFSTRWDIYSRQTNLLAQGPGFKVVTHLAPIQNRWRRRAINDKVSVKIGARALTFQPTGAIAGSLTGVGAVVTRNSRRVHTNLNGPGFKIRLMWNRVTSTRGYYNVYIHATAAVAARTRGLCARRGRRRRRGLTPAQRRARRRAACNRRAHAIRRSLGRRGWHAWSRCRRRGHPCAVANCMADYKRGLRRRPRFGRCRRLLHAARRTRNRRFKAWFTLRYHACRAAVRGRRRRARLLTLKAYCARFGHRHSYCRLYKRIVRRRRGRRCLRWRLAAMRFRRHPRARRHFLRLYSRCRRGRRGRCQRRCRLRRGRVVCATRCRRFR